MKLIHLNGNKDGIREIRGEMIDLVGQVGTEVPENKKVVKMYHMQLTGNIGLEFKKERRAGGYRF